MKWTKLRHRPISHKFMRYEALICLLTPPAPPAFQFGSKTKKKNCVLCWTKNIHLWFSSSRQIYCVAERSGVAFEAKSLSSDGYLDTIFQDGIVCAIVSVELHEVEKWLEGQILAWLVQDLPKIVLMRQSSIFTLKSALGTRAKWKTENFWAFCGFWRVDVWLNLDIVCLSTDVCFIGKLIFLTSISRLLRISVRIAIWISPLNEL